MCCEIFRITRCLCVPLKITSLIIGYISIVTSISTLCIISYLTYIVVSFVRGTWIIPDPEDIPEELEDVSWSMYVVLSYHMMVFSYNLMINIMLVVGIHRNNPQYLKVYLYTSYFLFILAVVLEVLSFFFMGNLATVLTLMWAFIVVMCIIIVRSTYMDMVEEQSKLRANETLDVYIITPRGAPLVT